MTRQFRLEKRGKNGHIFGKISHCAMLCIFYVISQVAKVKGRCKRWHNHNPKTSSTDLYSVTKWLEKLMAKEPQRWTRQKWSPQKRRESKRRKHVCVPKVIFHGVLVLPKPVRKAIKLFPRGR